MEWSTEVVAALSKLNKERQDARVAEILANPDRARMMRSMRGILEFQALHAPVDADILSFTDLVSGTREPIVRKWVAFIVWSIHPTHLGVAEDAEYFDLREVADVGRILKIGAEAEDTLSYKLKVLLKGSEERMTQQFDSLKRYGDADLHVYFEDHEHAVLTVTPTGTGQLTFASAVPKVVKADLTRKCPNCSKRNKDTADKCFGCKRLLSF
jgi:hypothetical protein